MGYNLENFRNFIVHMITLGKDTRIDVAKNNFEDYYLAQTFIRSNIRPVFYSSEPLTTALYKYHSLKSKFISKDKQNGLVSTKFIEKYSLLLVE
eukprot:UN23850